MINLNLPPEVRYVQLHEGAGAESLLAAEHAWRRAAEGLRMVALRISRVVTWVTGERWRGLAAEQMRSEADGVIREIRKLADKAAQAATSARAMAEAFDTARTAVVPREKIAANRRLIEQLTLTNLWGLNGPAVAAAQLEYDGMWAQDSAVMATYHRKVSEAAQELGEWPQLQ